MRVTVLVFGPHAAAIGARSASVTLEGKRTCGAVLDALRSQHPALAPLLGGARIARNQAFAANDAEIAADDELALIALVGGG